MRPLLFLLLAAGCGESTSDSCPDPVLRYPDGDGDGYGALDLGVQLCEERSGYVEVAGDCDDGDAAVHPGATALDPCDGVDNDCDGAVDDVAEGEPPTWYADDDGDGYGDPAAPTAACELPGGHVADDSDCDDAAAWVHPGGLDAPGDGVDADCSGSDATTLACDTIVPWPGALEITGAAAAAALTDLCHEHNAVGGALALRGTDLTELSALGCLCAVEGDLVVSGNEELESVSQHLPVSVEGDLVVEENPALTDLALFPEVVDGGLVLRANPLLESAILGLGCTLTGARIEDNPALTQLALDDLRELTGDLVLSGNGALTDLSAELDLTDLVRVGGDLVVADNALLAELSAPANLQEVGGDLVVRDNPSLVEMGDVMGSTYGTLIPPRIGGDLWLQGNPVLEGLVAATYPSVGGSVLLIDNPALAYCRVTESAPDPPEIGGDVVVLRTGHDNGDHCRLLQETVAVGGDLRMVDAGLTFWMDDLATLEGGLEIQGGGELTVVSYALELIPGDLSVLGWSRGSESPFSLPALTRVEGDVILSDVDGLSDTLPLASLAEIGGDLELDSCEDLADLSALGGLTSLDGDLWVHDNRDLEDLTGLGGLEEIGGSLALSQNDALQRLSGLEALTAIGQDLFIDACASLSDVSALHGLSSLGRLLTITDNPALATADAQALADAIDSIGGTVTISGNGGD